MNRVSRIFICSSICLIVSVCFGTVIQNTGFLTIYGKDAFAQNGTEPVQKGLEENPCPECPECPDSARIVLRGLEEKRAMIDKQQKALEQEKKELDGFKEQIDENIASLEALKKQIEEDLSLLDRKKTAKELEKEAQYEEKVGRLVKMYAGMKPRNAAEIVNKMDLDVAQEIFLRMREASASEILSFVDSEKAAQISARLAFKRKP